MDEMSADRIYEIFRRDPDSGRTSQLHDHYRRGRVGIMRPSAQEPNALAAWKAGRDAAKAETK